MKFDDIIKRYNKDGWSDLTLLDDNRARITCTLKKPHIQKSGRKVNVRHKYFLKYKCCICTQDTWLVADRTSKRTIGITCGVGTQCYVEAQRESHKGGNSGQYKTIYTRENPATDKWGYKYFRVTRKDKDGNLVRKKNGEPFRDRFYIHRLIVQEHIGRPIKRNERVHHIDMNKGNNNLNNLWLCTNKQHMTAHWSFNELCSQAFKKSVQFAFNKDKGEYYIK